MDISNESAALQAVITTATEGLEGDARIKRHTEIYDKQRPRRSIIASNRLAITTRIEELEPQPKHMSFTWLYENTTKAAKQKDQNAGQRALADRRREEEPTDDWPQEWAPRARSLREKFAHTGQVQDRHTSKGGIFQHSDGRLVFWLYDVLENMDGTPNWQQPYLWYRKLGFDIPAGEKRMLRELYASVFGGPCDSSTSLQHFGRAPACAAEAEHTLLLNRIHNTKDTRWSKHGAYNDDSSGAKKARLTEDAVWRPEWGVPNWGILLPDHWHGGGDELPGQDPENCCENGTCSADDPIAATYTKDRQRRSHDQY